MNTVCLRPYTEDYYYEYMELHEHVSFLSDNLNNSYLIYTTEFTKPVGYVRCYPQDDELYLDVLEVVDYVQGRGVGTEVVSYLKQTYNYLEGIYLESMPDSYDFWHSQDFVNINGTSTDSETLITMYYKFNH